MNTQSETYDVVPEEYGPEGRVEVWAVLRNGQQVGPAFGSESEARQWIEQQAAA